MDRETSGELSLGDSFINEYVAGPTGGPSQAHPCLPGNRAGSALESRWACRMALPTSIQKLA